MAKFVGSTHNPVVCISPVVLGSMPPPCNTPWRSCLRRACRRLGCLRRTPPRGSKHHKAISTRHHNCHFPSRCSIWSTRLLCPSFFRYIPIETAQLTHLRIDVVDGGLIVAMCGCIRRRAYTLSYYYLYFVNALLPSMPLPTNLLPYYNSDLSDRVHVPNRCAAKNIKQSNRVGVLRNHQKVSSL